VRADQKLPALIELESAVRACQIALTGWGDFSKLGVATRILNQAEDFPRWFVATSRPAIALLNAAGKRKEEET
jgi:hypothetical protein